MRDDETPSSRPKPIGNIKAEAAADADDDPGEETSQARDCAQSQFNQLPPTLVLPRAFVTVKTTSRHRGA